MSTCECRDGSARRDYIDETTYVCRGLYQVGIDHYGYPVVFSCDTEMIDHEAVARIEAKREREEQVRRKRTELMEAVVQGQASAMYCACGTRAVRRCARCERDLCNDDDRCCTWRTEPRGWVCGECDRALDHEAREAKRAREARAKAAYEALPAPGVHDLARYLDGERSAIVDGTTHRTDRVTHAAVAAAYTALMGAGAEGVSWTQGLHPREQVELRPDGTLYTSTGTLRKNPGDRFDLASAPARADLTTLADVRERREREAAQERAEARRQETRRRRERFVALVHSALRPFLAISPAFLLVSAAILAYRTDLAVALAEPFRDVPSGWANAGALLLIPLVPLTLYAVFAGGFALANRLRERAWARAVRAALIAWISPVILGIVAGPPLFGLSPTLRAMATSPVADALVAFYSGW